jgi:hypothetical protein
MRQLMKAVVGSSLLLFGLTASAQYPPRSDRYQDRGEDRDPGRLCDRIVAHLDRAEASALPFTADKIRVARAREDVRVFQRKLDSGELDRRDLDDVIVSLQRVVADNHMLTEDNRDQLAADVSRMRDFRASYSNW